MHIVNLGDLDRSHRPYAVALEGEGNGKEVDRKETRRSSRHAVS